MPPQFHSLAPEEFAEVLQQFPLQRRIDAIHLHHTYWPRQDDFKGYESLAALWRYHTEVQRWNNIAAHVLIAPDGTIWSGRNWNQPPVSVAGHNGSRHSGPFMISLVGDFNAGADRFEGAQKEAALEVIARVQQKAGLPPASLIFVSQISARRSPGTTLDRDELVAELENRHAQPAAAPVEVTDPTPFESAARRAYRVAQALNDTLPLTDEPGDSEPQEDTMSAEEMRDLFSRGGMTRNISGEARGLFGRPAGLTPEVLESLRPHVINLSQGQFSGGGLMRTSKEDVDAIFEEHLPAALEAAQAASQPLRLVLYAHGGLVAESSGLLEAHKHIVWWKQQRATNDDYHVYPLYFVWETGLLETIGGLLNQAIAKLRGVTRDTTRGARDIYDYTSDPAIQEVVRALQAPRIWGGMKRNAALSSQAGGGALYAAQKLAACCKNAGADALQLHAVGHSAGAIFQSHFLPAAVEAGAPPCRTLQFLAPAIRVDAFRSLLGKRIGADIEDRVADHLTIFTMSESYERDDFCGVDVLRRTVPLYRKSLLYLIYYALEPQRQTDILGLERSLRRHADLKALLGIGSTSASGQVVLSKTAATTGRSASHCTEHGAFDDDPQTMESVARRVLGLSDTNPVHAFPKPATRGLSSWEDQFDWPEDLDYLFDNAGFAAPSPVVSTSGVSTPVISTPVVSAPITPSPATATSNVVSGGRRRALCAGIDTYSIAPLFGCVADARMWGETLTGLGFTVEDTLLNEAATRQNLLNALSQLVTTSRAGDVLVFQYAGHGTTLPDESGDETGGDSPQKDEALCPVDFDTGAYIIDDDLGAIFNQVPAGVNLTCFIDCCHSGTITRLGVGAPTAGVGSASVSRAGAGRAGRPIARYLPATSEMIERHRRFRQSRGRDASQPLGGLSRMREVLFAACLSSEVAFEQDGHGDYTLRATARLKQGITGLTNESFEKDIVTGFGSNPRQHPRLYCHPEVRALGLLQAHSDAESSAVGRGAASNALTASNTTVNTASNTAQLLRAVAKLVEDGR